jgi:hypothetical protein
LTKWYNKNMAKNNPRISRSGVTTSGTFPLYTNSPEVNDFDPALVRYIRGNSLSSVYLAQGDVDAEDVDLVSGFIVTSPEDDEETAVTSSLVGLKVPSVSDISIVSNTVVYDAAGNPSVTVVFKIKNSSGITLKGMNARVELA